MKPVKWTLNFLLVLAVILGLVIGPPLPGKAKAEGVKYKLIPELLLPEQPEFLSGRAWLITAGLDPGLRLGSGGDLEEGPGITLQAVGPAGAALIPYRSPAAKFSRTILVSRDKGRLPIQCGPHLAVDPKDPDHIVIVLMDYNFPGITSYVSIDGGATWDGPFQPKISREARTGVGDPVVVFDKEGNLYAAQMSLDVKYFWLEGVTGTALVFNIEVNRSEDGGYTWTDTVTAAPGGVLVRIFPSAGEKVRGEVEVTLNDKPWITVGPNPEDPDKEIIYLTYTRFKERWKLAWMDEIPVLQLVEESTAIQLVYSEDGGLTWSQPVRVSPRVVHWGEATRRVVQGSQPVVGPDGTLYVAWFDSTDDDVWEGQAQIWVASSNDGGRTFSSPHLAATFLENPFSSRVTSFRFWGTSFPQMAIGPEGEIYIAYTSPPPDNPQDEGDVFIVRSFDGGKTWERRVRVNDDKSGRMQFFPSVTVDSKGIVHTIWGDTRDDPTQLCYHIYYSYSKDKGKTWEFNSRVSDFPSNPNYAFPHGRYIGDYFTIKAAKDDVYITWADSRLGEVSGINQKIAFARKKLMPTPAVFVSPPSGPAGRDIIIKGHHFQPESQIFVEIGGVIVATGRTKEDGTFSLKLFVPITGKGARSLVVKDISGNLATASFYTEFGFDSFKELFSQLEGQLQKLEKKKPSEVKSKPSSPENTTASNSASPGEGFPWLIAVLAGALVVALSALGVVLFRTHAKS